MNVKGLNGINHIRGKKSHIQVNETRHAFDEDWLDERVTV